MILSLDQTESIPPLKRALLALEDMQAKLKSFESAQREPIAIIGMGCRFPGGADSPEAFWTLLRDGKDAITEVPSDRWNLDTYYDPNPDAPGKIYTRKGGFLSQVDGFDAQFFGISAREAGSLDPQQRLLLEVSWEALEHANQAPDHLVDSLTGVFIGICSNDYNKMIWQAGGAAGVDAFCATGNALSIAAGRLSYILGFRGPSLAIDTACSSSLVAVHQACQNLRQRECHLALAGGVHLLLSPDTSIAFSRTHMLDPDGYCKTFDAAANGYGRGEGCGVVVLKRLSDAVAEGNNILAVIRGSAVNHNGRSSSLIAPNGSAQQTLMQQALDKGGIHPSQVSYVEVQGTGTALGQSLEVEALARVFSQNRSAEQPLIIGSVKTNIGHLEAAAGVASLIKVILALQHQEIPPHLHLKQPNPYVNWDALRVKVPTECMAWHRGDNQQRIAGISGFGFSGTNAHLCVEEAPAIATVASSSDTNASIERPFHFLALSAKTETALNQLVEHYQHYLAIHSDCQLADLCFSANTGRSQFQHRLGTIAASTLDLQDQLAAFTQGQASQNYFNGKGLNSPRVAFRFSDETAWVAGMGQQLYQTQPTFRKTLDHCQALLQSLVDSSLSQILFEETHNLRNVSPALISPALFALEYALCQLWLSWGVVPTVVIGAGVGEYVAACVAGVFSLEDGLRLALQRGRCLQASACETAEIKEFERLSKTVLYTQQHLSLISGLTGELDDRAVATSEYWCHQWQQFANLPLSMKTLHQQKCDVFLEVGPCSDGWEIKPQTPAQSGVNWLSSLHPTGEDWHALLKSLGTMYVKGVKPDWKGFEQGYFHHRLYHLPTYPWQRQRYWVEAASDESKNNPVQVSSQTESEIAAMPQIQQHHLTAADIQAWLVTRIARELGVGLEEIDLQAPFDSYGLDSMLAIGIASSGTQYLGLEVSPLLLFHYPSIDLLSQHLAEELAKSETEMFEL